MSCTDFSGNSTCRTITLIEPDDTLLTGSGSGGTDQSIDESGSVILSEGQTQVNVTFLTTKASENYRFEYLYVDAFGVVNPGDVAPVPTVQTVFGFTVKLAGTTVHAGYVLRWRVVVFSLETIITLDQPETLYRQLPQVNLFTVVLVNPRTTSDWHFRELAVENLTDDPAIQSPVAIQVVAKTQTSFTIALSPTPPSPNYYLAAEIP